MTPKELANKFQAMDFDYFINAALDRVPSNLDTREGSVIYDAIAPAAYVMAEMSLNVADTVLNTFTQTASGEYLDYRAEERGLTREQATFTQLTATLTDANGQPLVADIGDRFASIGVEPIYYKLTKLSNVSGQATLTAETAGEVGNSYIGQLLPISAIAGFGNAVVNEVIIPARNAETDDELRERLLTSNEVIAFGGNVADYIKFIVDMEDVAAVQVYPTWNGGGTVKAVILNNQYLAPSQTLIDQVKNAIDPVNSSGNGYGIAPVGHTVTIVAPVLRTINVGVTINTTPTVTVEDVRQKVEQAIDEYFNSVREKWGDINADDRTYTVTLYRSQIIVALLKVDGVTNATNVTFDGEDNDITLTTNATTEELPMLGTVTIDG
ncbi:baseplate J/gp47 family protein [Leuconostoc citreum]|uniref:baseplate J/gp47 family protein n=1 Tax=Leuconostoc citreum TaxID=33964 RepID=UPI0021A3E4A5|nr:baseplate J/gp47 family protein [Leuconostoc citreum]MCT3075351.1 baseplate J/gp47 family protein [Leuconostoc citreum]